MKNFLFLLLLVAGLNSYSQKLSFDSLNTQRIKINQTGMKILGSWSAANIVAGGAGYFASTDKEWKAFHGMNAAWCVVNIAIAGLGYMGTQKEAKEDYDCASMLLRHEANKRLYLINAGLDITYICGGLLLNSYAYKFKSPETWYGFGKSIALQGVFLLIFDGTMYSMHAKQNKKWYRVLQGICVSGNGVGWRYKM